MSDNEITLKEYLYSSLHSMKEAQEQKHNDIMSELHEIKDDVKETKKQALMTNGKVAKLTWWKNSFVWALGALWTVILIAFPVLRSIVQNEIRDTVQATLSEYYIEVIND